MRHAVFLGAAVLLALCTRPVHAETVKLAGSASVVSALVNPNRDRIEKASGHSLQLVSHGSGKGLADLADQNADIAMISAPLDAALAAAELAGRKVDAGALRVHELQADEIVFLVHQANPVSRLTLGQVGDIHSGKVTNWKQVGGKDQPISVYTTAAAGGTSYLVRKLAMGGSDYAAGSKTMASLARIPEMIRGDEGAIGAVGRDFARSDGKTKVVEGARIARTLALVTLGEPSPKARQVIDALKAAAAAQADIGAACPTQVKPEMPRKAIQEGVAGVVKAQAKIRDGAVREVTILSGQRVFHSAVRDAMLQYKCIVRPGELLASQEFVFKAAAD